MTLTNLDLLKNEFLNYLSSLGITPKSHKNYKSDLNHFSGWAILKIKALGVYAETLSDVIPFLNINFLNQYKSYLLENKSPIKTINRRLSTLRHLSRFLMYKSITSVNFMEGIENTGILPKNKYNIDPVLDDFRNYLLDQKTSSNTVKNYLSDIKQFISWLETTNKNEFT